MAELRHEKRNALIKRMAAQFIETISNQTSMITVTDVQMSDDLKKCAIFITVFPDSKESIVLDFVKRNLTEMRDYIREHAKMGMVPFLDIQIDQGEKNRQKIEGLLRE